MTKTLLPRCCDPVTFLHSFRSIGLIILTPSAGAQDSNGGNMFHLIWYVIVGLIAGFVAKSVMHMHLTLVWTIVLGIVGSIVGGCVTHMFSRPKPGAQFHPAGIIFSILGALLVLFVWYKLKLHLPRG
jgi:uncharacterized membrane protein YeaQ/YmgE (transglycosylase-associated protein family)